MLLKSPSRRLLLFLTLYLTFCSIAGIFVAHGTLHPARRALTAEAETAMCDISHHLDPEFEGCSITTPDVITLRAWTIHPHRSNGDAVILLHGLGDNRMGMTGYAQLLLAHGFSVLLPDARAHGASGGDLATYGLLERDDIRQWFGFLAHVRPRCILDSPNPWVPPNSYNLSLSNHASVPSLPNHPSLLSARSPTTAWVSPFTSAPGSAALCSAPSSNLPFSMFAGNITSTCSKPRQEIQSQPPLFQSCSFTVRSIATFRSGTPVRSMPMLPTQFFGKFRTLTIAAPSAPLLKSSKAAFSHGFPANPHLP